MITPKSPRKMQHSELLMTILEHPSDCVCIYCSEYDTRCKRQVMPNITIGEIERKQ